MIITRIEEFKKDRFKVFIDEEFAFVLYKGELKSYKLKVGESLSQDVYSEINNELLPKRAKLRAMGLLKSHMYTEKGLRDKLRESGHNQENIDIAIEYVKSYKYIDDEEYARQYIMSRLESKSKLELKLYLQRKGISQEIFENVYNEYIDDDSGVEIKLIEKLLNKRLKGQEINDISKEELNKHIAYLLNKGFTYNNIIKCINYIDK